MWYNPIMESRSIFLNISPLDHRYSLSEAKVFDDLSSFISEQAAIISCAKAETALIKAHLKMRGTLDAETEKNSIRSHGQSIRPAFMPKKKKQSIIYAPL